MLTRRSLFVSAAASALLPYAPPAIADDRARFPACGCINPRPTDEFGACLTHDAKGRRWDSYTGREVAEECGYKVFVAGFDGEASYCCAPGSFQPMPKGTLMAGWMSGYYEPEYEEKCLECVQREWVLVQTTDWLGIYQAHVSAPAVDEEKKTELGS